MEESRFSFTAEFSLLDYFLTTAFGILVSKASLEETWPIFFHVKQENIMEKEMATHSSILAWEIPCTEEPGGLQSMGLQRVGHD